MNFRKMANKVRERLSGTPATAMAKLSEQAPTHLSIAPSVEANSNDLVSDQDEPPDIEFAAPELTLAAPTTPVIEPQMFSATAMMAVPGPAPTSEAFITLNELQEIFAGSDWSKLMRNARDGGATSILACRILEKTMVLLEHGYKQVELMMVAAQDVRTTSDQLSSVSEDIKLVSNQTRIVSINASIEARRAGEHGRAFHVVAQEMTNLSDDARQLTQSIDVKLNGVNEKIAVNRELCLKVGRLFTNMNKELDEFRRLMMRVEQLSGIQVEQLGTIEKRLTTMDK